MSVPTAEQETAPRDDFDSAVDAYVEQGQPAAAGDTPPARPATPAPADVPAPVAAAPVAPPADEPDDDDETLTIDQRFARAQRREQKITARQAELTTERQRAIDQANGYKGNLAQEKARREAIEAERDRFKGLAESENARIDHLWAEAIAQTDDPTQKAELQRRYDFDRRERELAEKEAQIAFKAQQEIEQAERVKQEQVGAATEGMRQHVVPSLVGPMEEFATAIGLPLAELADIRATLNSRPMRQMFARLTPEELHAYRNELGEGIFEEIAQRAQAFKTRQTATNRQEAATVYRAEQPVGAGGGRPGKTWDEMDIDEALDAMYDQQQ